MKILLLKTRMFIGKIDKIIISQKILRLIDRYVLNPINYFLGKGKHEKLILRNKKPC